MSDIPIHETVIPEVSVVKLGAPLFAQYEVTGTCPYKCIFCYNSWRDPVNTEASSTDLSKEDSLLAVQKLIDCEIFSLIFSGGEPMCAKHLPLLVKLVASAGIETSMISNGALFTKDNLKELKDCGLESIQISMHHYIPSTMDGLTQIPKSWERTKKGIELALKVFGDRHIGVNMVVVNETVLDVLGMGYFIKGLGVESFSVGLTSYTGSAALNDIVVGQDELKLVYGQLEKLHHELDLSVGLTGGMPLCVVPGNGQEGVVDISNVCDAGIHQIVVGPDGGLRPCVEMLSVVGNIITDDIRDVWQKSEELIRIREFENVPISCHSCKMVAECHGGCRAAALAHSGEYLGLDPLMIEVNLQ